ncbi:MAG: tetratricopeptide repeat protein [Candidatus Helarchaeota archaeon]
MPLKKNIGILKILDEIKSKTLPKDEVIARIAELGEKGSKSLAEELIPLLDEFESEDIRFQLRDTLGKLEISTDYLNGEGIKREDNGDYDGAIRMYELCVKLDPYYQWAWYNMGRMYGDKKKDNEKAISAYKKAVSVNDNYGDAWNNLGNIYSRINQLSLSRDAYEKSLKCSGYKSKHFPSFNLGLLYEKLGTNQKALDYFLEALEIKPDYTKAMYNCGLIYKKLGNIEKSWEYFAKTLKHDQTYEEDIRESGINVEEVVAVQLLKELDNFETEPLMKQQKNEKKPPKPHGSR